MSNASSLSIRLPTRRSPRSRPTRCAARAPSRPRRRRRPFTRIAYSAAHVVADPLARESTRG